VNYVESKIEAELRKIARVISEEPDVIAVIIHGSSAHIKCDELNDVDVLVVVAKGPIIHETRLTYSRPLDIYMGTEVELNAKLHTVDPLNNNFVLNALISGSIKFDINGSATCLQAEARKLWAKGPQAMSMAEYKRAQTALHRMLASAEKWTLRSAASAEARIVAGFRRTQVMVQAIYLYHRVRRLWTSGLPQTLQSMKNHHKRAYDLWTRYIGTIEEKEQLLLVRSMVDIAFQNELIPRRN
jgi:predicted nucleotidyltransferase